MNPASLTHAEVVKQPISKILQCLSRSTSISIETPIVQSVISTPKPRCCSLSDNTEVDITPSKFS